MFFDDWQVLQRTLVVGLLAYCGLVLALRISGKRTLSKWNAFDFIVTIALGSSLATALLSRDVPLVQGLLAFAVLIGAQYLVTWLNVRIPWVEKVSKARPTLLLYRGKLQEEVMRRQRVPAGEVLMAVRSQGYARLEDVAAVVLESDGSFSVIGSLADDASALADVAGIPGHVPEPASASDRRSSR